MDIFTHLCLLCLLPFIVFVQSQTSTTQIPSSPMNNSATVPTYTDFGTSISTEIEFGTNMPNGTSTPNTTATLVSTPPAADNSQDGGGGEMTTSNGMVTSMVVGTTTPMVVGTTAPTVVTTEMAATDRVTTETAATDRVTTEWILTTTLTDESTRSTASPAATEKTKTPKAQPQTSTPAAAGTCKDAPDNFCPGDFKQCVDKPTGGYECQDKTCENSGVCSTHGDVCMDHADSFMCECGPNRTLNAPQSDCEDITCENAPAGKVCTGQGEMCENVTGGGYVCKCTDKFTRDAGDTRCEERVVTDVPGGKVTPPSHHYAGAIVGIFIVLIIACILFVFVYMYRRRLRNNYGRLDEEREGDNGWSAFSKNPIYRGDKDYQLL